MLILMHLAKLFPPPPGLFIRDILSKLGVPVFTVGFFDGFAVHLVYPPSPTIGAREAVSAVFLICLHASSMASLRLIPCLMSSPANLTAFLTSPLLILMSIN